jgi:4-nitrophenyl phosphatase
MASLHNMRAFIIDMDGVLWTGDQPMPGLRDFFATLRERQTRFVLATNNASQTPEQYVEKLAKMGVSVAREEILTSAQAAALYLRQTSMNGAKVFAIGEDGVRQALTEHGFSLGELYEVNAQFVVCGMDRSLSWDKLATATLNIRAGAKFIGTNPDTTLPTERGLTHGNGAILAALQAATGIAPIIIGKPEPIMYQMAMMRLGSDANTTAAIGDRLETDILGAVRAGICSVLALSGISTREQLPGLAYQPTWVMQDIAEINRALRQGL